MGESPTGEQPESSRIERMELVMEKLVRVAKTRVVENDPHHRIQNQERA